MTGVKVAIKFYYWGSEPDLHSEPRSLAQFNSPYVVPILSADLIREGWACFISPRFPGDLEGMILRGRISTHFALDVGINVLSGLGGLHASSLVHRDVKPANIFLNADGVAAIGDLGSVATLQDETGDVPSSRHSVLYRPPESFLTGRFDPRGDIYQLGVTLYEAFGAELPKDAVEWMSQKELGAYQELESDFDRSAFEDGVMRAVITGRKLIRLERLPYFVSRKTRNAIALMTSKDPVERPKSVADAMALLVDARRQSIDWTPTAYGAIGDFVGGSARVLADGRVEVDRGRGLRRDRTLEGLDAMKSVAKVNSRLA
ncbi:protein kinase [Xanthomonas translucens pv. graminis]|uniref:protein kinase domain-containing protein n=1 Tax=Xanthomonas graminis TaxID=3390026 RepID=UPI0025422640|nr:protein kinase [Xanthomonas translucens]WIH04636.1 protein kinase [Xanthomonas translucens pv. graminis]